MKVLITGARGWLGKALTEVVAWEPVLLTWRVQASR
jgi:dTDP-4-dehydrorhamnose reductase